MLFTLAIGISAVYMLASFVSYLLIAKKRSFAKAGNLFYTD